MATVRAYVFSMSIISFFLAIIGQKWLNSGVRDILTNKVGLSDSDSTTIIAFLVVVFIWLGALLVLGFTAEKVFNKQKQRLLKNRQRTLTDVIDKCGEILKRLDDLEFEIGKEINYDPPSLRGFAESVKDVHDLLRLFMVSPKTAVTGSFAQRVWALIEAVYDHATNEIRQPLENAGLRKVKEALGRANWGIGCVRLLVLHLQRETVAHPVFTFMEQPTDT